MDSPLHASKILYTNAKYFGIDLKKMYLEAGQKISEKLIGKFGKSKSYAFICGLGGNAGDGLATIKYLIKEGVDDVSLYLVGRQTQFEDVITNELFEDLKKYSSLKIKQDAYAEDVVQEDVVVECLVGTGLIGDQLNKRFRDIIKRISHFKSQLIAIDKPAPSYAPDIVYSLVYPKTTNAQVIDINIPKDLTIYSGPGEVEALFKPKRSAYKSKNGKILYITNTEKLDSIERLLRIADAYLVNVYIYNPNRNFESKNISKLLTNYEVIDDNKVDEYIGISDSSIFWGDFENMNILNRALITEILRYKGTKQVLFGDAIDYVHPNSLNGYTDLLVMPDQEQKVKFLDKGNSSIRRLASENKYLFSEFGLRSTIYSSKGELVFDRSGIFIKAQYQKFLAMLSAVLGSKNDLWLAAKAGLFLTEQLQSQNKLNDFKFLESVLLD